ncbi:hypothetical protein QQX98_012882 [Neonectria punicea]|uniref:Clr5 domain-containing protein n=1 Tax=Neonectria punicea TaxID=979145 RepID=A0ABR1GHW3_9HYPO
MPVNWSPYEAEVLKLYVEERKTAEETLKCLNQKHGTRISIQQFKLKFGGLKKLRAHEWQEVDREILKRRDQGKASDVYVCGQRQEPSRIKRALEHSRTKKRLSAPDIDWTEEICKRRRVEIRTPEPRHFPQPEIENSSTIPTILENPASPEGLESEPPIAIENEGFMTDLGFNLDDIELNFSTPKLDYHFLPNLSSGLNPLGFSETNSPSNSLLPNELGSNGLFSEVFIPDTFNIETGFPAIDWDKLHARVPKGKAGWLESQLLSMDSNVMLRKPAAGLLEDVLHNTTGNMEIRFDGYNRDSLHQIFTVVTHLISNKSLDWKPLLNFIRWVIENGSVAELFTFLQKDLCNKSNLVREVLDAISIETERIIVERTHFSYPYERPFHVEYQIETVNLIREADNRTLSGALGGRLLVLVAESKHLNAVKLLVDSGVPIDHLKFSSHDIFSPLCGAVCGGSADILEYLLDKGADANECFSRKTLHRNKTSALTEAVKSGNTDMVRILLGAGAKVIDGPMINNMTICKYARRNSTAIYQLLQESLELGLASGDAVNLSLLVEAAEMGNNSLSPFLLKHGIVRQEILEAGLCRAIEMGNVGAVRTLLHRGIDPNALRHRQSLHSENCTEDPDEDSDDDSDDDPDEDSGDDSDDDPDDDLETKVERDHPLFQASDVVSADMVYLLVKAGATVSEATLAKMCDRLQEQDEGQDVLIAMVQARFNVSVVGPCALEAAATYGSIAKTGALLDAGIDINAYGGGGKSALQAAAGAGHLALVQYLLERGADVNLPAGDTGNWFRVTALQAAALGGRSEVVDCLLEAGADVRAPPAKKEGFTVLEAAAKALRSGYPSFREERAATFRKLLTLGAPVTRTDGTGCLVLHSLVQTAEMQCLQDVLGAGASTEDYSSYFHMEMTPFQVAAAFHNIDAMQLLLDHNANINAPASNALSGRTGLQAAINCGVLTKGSELETEATVRFLLQINADVNAPASNYYGRTALQAATSAQPNAKIVALLLQHGADVNADPAGKGGITALQGAAISGDIQIAKVLLAHGANVNAPGALKKGRTAIEGAAEHGRLDMVRLLLDSDVTPDANDGFTKAIELAEGRSYFEIADILRERQRVHVSSFIGLIDQPAWNSELLPLDLDVIITNEDDDTLQLW